MDCLVWWKHLKFTLFWFKNEKNKPKTKRLSYFAARHTNLLLKFGPQTKKLATPGIWYDNTYNRLLNKNQTLKNKNVKLY